MNPEHHLKKIARGEPRVEESACQNPFFHLSDKELWSKFKAGDEAAFIHIYQQYFDNLVNYCFQFTQDEDLIKDCVQDLFIYLRNKREQLSSTNNIKLYLFKSCKNNILKSIKEQVKNHSVYDINFFPTTFSIEEKIIHLQTKKVKEKSLASAINKLSSREREIIYYFYYENLDYKEIAALLNYKEVKSVRSLLYKSLRKLRGYIISLVLACISFII